MVEIFKVIYRKSDLKWVWRSRCLETKKWVTRWEVEDCEYVQKMLTPFNYRRPKYVLTNIQAFDTLQVIGKL